MVISPNDFSLWARLTGNKYPSTPKERAQKGPEVQNFIQNLDKEGMLGGKEAEEPKKENNLGKKIATGALIAGGVAAAVAAGRDKRVQDVAQRAASTTKTKIDDFLSNLGGPRVVDRDVIDASYDITPDPIQQQSNVGSQVNKFLSEGSYKRNYKPNVNVDIEIGPDSYTPPVSQRKEPVIAKRTPVSTGQIYGTESAISKETPYDDIGNIKQRAQIAQDKRLGGLHFEYVPKSGQDYLTRQAAKDRDYDLAYMVARGQGKTDEAATRIAYQARGMSESEQPLTIRKPTQHREFLSNLKTGSIRPESIDNLLNLVKTGPQINLPESVQEPGALVQLAAGSTPSNKVPTMGPTIGGSSLTDQHATEMAVDNALDNARANYDKQISTIVEAGQTKGGSISKSAKAEQFLQKIRPTVVKELDKAIQEDLTKTTGLNPEDASNIAGSIINPITGQREFNTDQFGSTGAVKRDLKDLKSVPNIDPETKQGSIKTAVGTSIRGRAPSYDQTRFVERTREDINDPKGGELPDIQGGISGPSAQELLKRKSGELMQYTGKRPAGQEFTSETRLSPTTVPNTDIDPQTGKPKGGVKLGPLVETAGAKPLGERAPRTPVRRIISPAADQGDPGPGIGIYGEGTGFLPGPFSKTAEKAPTDTFGVRSPFKGVSDSTLIKLKSDMKPGTKSFDSVDKEQRGRASMDAARELRKIQTLGDPNTSTERVAKFLDNLKKQQGG